ncbi:hypothetical protein CQA53_08165 [Helicobacter didelphidarum]|uniref:Valyl-tRNA synthetase n=1 Tax=Helicobacter didelphidarum TaxID=2040648 RepID=A0A3D8IFZ3_9HELI|nr:DUF5718 family protein [Helicobacter didelphidarum]RDU64048.1 hypothetical protein CQA53_08165 [Helicobacter didelphidarum]
MEEILGLGVAGNFTNHLEQAGESKDFANIISDEEGAPKGLFPFYVPYRTDFLGRYCINSAKVVLPENHTLNVQAEPEIALECDIIYENNKVKSLIPKYFMAFNDASIRNDIVAKKLSQKKNFSVGSKGLGNKILLDKFDNNGICDDYSLTSFLIDNGKIHQYGDNISLLHYSYFYKKLIDWIIKKLNTQTEHAVLEDFSHIIQEAKYPKKYLIAIGSTSYTHFAEERFLKEGDEICIIAYNHKVYDNKQIQSFIQQGVRELDHTSILRQQVCLK